MFIIYNVSNCYIRLRHTFRAWDEPRKTSRYSVSGFRNREREGINGPEAPETDMGYMGTAEPSREGKPSVPPSMSGESFGNTNQRNCTHRIYGNKRIY